MDFVVGYDTDCDICGVRLGCAGAGNVGRNLGNLDQEEGHNTLVTFACWKNCLGAALSATSTAVKRSRRRAKNAPVHSMTRRSTLIGSMEKCSREEESKRR